MVYPALLPLMRAPRLPAVDWTDAPAGLNGLVRFAERQSLVSARVPSRFKRSLHSTTFAQRWNRLTTHFSERVRVVKRRISVLLSDACPAVPYFSAFSHKRYDFRKKKSLNTKCLFWFSLQLLSETFLVLRRTERDVIKNVYWSSCKVPVILVLDFNVDLHVKYRLFLCVRF